MSVGTARSKPFVSHSLLTLALNWSTRSKRPRIRVSSMPAFSSSRESRARESSSVRLAYSTGFCVGCGTSGSVFPPQPAREARMRLTAARIASRWFFRFINYVTFPVFVHSAMQNRVHHTSLYYTHIGEKYLCRIPGATLTAAVSSCFPIRSAAYGQRIPQAECA